MPTRAVRLVATLVVVDLIFLPKTCGAAIGGSFTFADDVSDSEA